MRWIFSKNAAPLLAVLIAAQILFGCCGVVQAVVTITKADGETLLVRVEIADSAGERARGLMYRENLPEGEGMLFLFSEETQGSFWMKNTWIPLDMIFIRDGRIVSLIENAVPYSETPLTPESPYTMTLEVPGGYVAQHGLSIGDAIEYR